MLLPIDAIAGTPDNLSAIPSPEELDLSPESEVSPSEIISPVSATALLSGANLVITSASAPTTASAGANIFVSWTVENLGSETTTSDYWYDRVVFSTNYIFGDYDDIYLTDYYITSYERLPLDPNETYTVHTFLTLSSQAIGNGYLLFTTDSYNYQAETDENDNVYIYPQAIEIAPPDMNLTITAATAPTTASAGGSIDLSWTVKNDGSVTAGSSYWYDRVVFSTNQIFGDSDDIYLTENYISSSNGLPLDPNETYTVNTTLTLPNQAIGNGYLLFTTDAYNYQAETDENDNVYRRAISIAGPNLTITAATAPTTANAGQSIDLSWTVKNDGSGATVSSYWYDRVVFSTNDIFGDSDDIYLTENYISSSNGLPLDPNETYTVNTTLTLPNQAIGNGYLLFKTDNYNYQTETNESDNVYSRAISIAVPNLTISAATAPTSAILGQSIAVSWTVLNNGSVPANADWYDSVYLSNDQTLDSGDLRLSSFWQSARTPLAAGGSYTDKRNISISSSVGTGDRYLIFATDYYSYYDKNQQGETDETDNTYVLPITLGAPDLIVSAATAPATGVVKGAINVSWTVKNQGQVSAPADWYDYIYLSTDATYSTNDTYLFSESISAQTPLTVNGTYTVNRSITLPNVAPGTYYLVFRADSNNAQGETDETNNDRSVAIAIGAPDLIVSEATAPESAALGATVSVSWTVQNRGTVEAPADWSDYLYWSSDNVYDASDRLITRVSAAAQTPVAADGSYTRTQNITLPTQLGSIGNGYLIFRADGNSVQGETDETNNTRAIAFRVEAPDLTVSNASAPESVTAGATFTVSWEVKNQGTVAANGDWYDSIYVSTDAIYDSSDTYLNSYWAGSLTPLASNGTYTASQNISVSSALTGDRYLLFVTDRYYYDGYSYNNLQGETDETNNVRAIALNISASDLQVSAATAPVAAVSGDTIELTWTVTNQGTGAATRDWTDRVYLSNNQSLDSGDVQVTSEWISEQTPLAAGASYTISKNVALPSFTPGNQYLLFVADRDNYQAETNENNNLRAVAITLSAPDLIVSAASAPATGTIGQSIEVSWTVRNQGTVAAPADWTDRIYLSNDAVFDANADTLIANEGISVQTPLAAGDSYSITKNITLPNFATGDRYLIFVTDGSGSQGETDNNNNTRAVAIALNAPDLVVSAITAPVESLSGQPIDISWTVTNQGQATADGTWTDRLYLVNATTGAYVRNLGYFSFTGTLAAGASLERLQSFTPPIDLVGDYKVVATTDYSGNIAEGTQNEENNTTTDDRSLSIQLSPVPNLQVSSVTAPPTAFSSQSTVVRWTVTNAGTGATNAPVWYDAVYLSLDSVFDNTDTYLGQAINPGYLNVGDSYSNSLTVTLPRGIEGNYYFLVKTDANSQVAEVGNEGDNLGNGGPVAVTLTPPPDLRVTTVNAPGGAFSGQTMNLSWTVTNAGTGRTLETAWYDRVFMSVDETLDAGDRILGTFYHGGALNAGQNYTGSAAVTLPIGVAGNYFFFVQTDIYNNVYEHVFESNNSGYDTTATTITLTPPPDLEFEYLTVPSNARSGETLSIDYRVTNYGATETPNSSWTDTFYLSADNQLNTATDLLLGSIARYGILNSGDSYARSVSFNLGNTLTGTYYVFGVTDSGNVVFELDNNNNAIRSGNPVQIVSRPADLVVTEAIVPATGEAGKTISVQWTVRNQGTGNTIVTGWSDRIVASTDGIFGDADDITLATFNRNGLLAPDGSYSRTETVTLPFSLEGDYRIFVVTDSGNSVYEGSQENNNVSSALPLTVTRQTPDLQVTGITLPATLTSGTAIDLSWTVTNAGTGRTNSNYWYDEAYLSHDTTLGNDDTRLGSFFRSNALDPGQSYTASATFTLPRDLSGNYYILVRTDRDNNVIEGAFENNNVKASDSASGGGTVPIVPVPSADLVVDRVDAPEQAIAGQPLNVTWTVANNGDNTGQTWYDAVYLSRDLVFDRSSDIYLGYQSRAGGLNSGNSYTATGSFTVPRGLAGRYYAFVVTDSGKAVYERDGEGNNTNFDGFSTEIILPSPADLVAGTITVPASGIPGQNATISYTVTNQGANEAIGTWEDTLYISQDNQWDVGDAFFGRVSHTGPVSAGGSYSKTVTATLPGVATGDYYVIVRSDIRDTLPETNENNNLGASLDDFTLDVESLALGTPDMGTLGRGQAIYYRVDVPAGETLLLNFDSQSTTAANELYIRYGEMPSRVQYDFGYSQPFSPDQEIVIPSTRGGTYYILAYGNNVSGGTNNYSITADILEYSITDLGTVSGSNRGQTTIRISGAKFTPGDVISLIGNDGLSRQASRVWWKDSTELWATFDLQGLNTGLYDVKVNNSTRTATLEDSFTVTNGGIGRLETQINLPSALRPGQAGVVSINYANTGETDIVSPLLVLSALDANLQLPDGTFSDSYQFLAIGSEGPAGILSPGERGVLSLVFQPTVSTGNVNLTLRSLGDSDESLNWSEIKENSRPDFISDAAWEVIWRNFVASVGETPREYVAALADNANTFSQLGQSIRDASQLIATEIQQASSTLLGNTLSSQIDASSPASGLSLSFARFFQSSFDGRLKLGEFGYGWTHLWDMTATTDAEGNVTIQESGNYRLFERQTDGSYIGQSGDYGTLSLAGNSYRLQEPDGTVTMYRGNGKLDYLEDRNRNRITAGYTDNRLTELTHSNGDRFTLTYNTQGRISQLTDATGQITTYTYDASGEHLVSVTDVRGTVSYTYENSSDPARQNALRSITLADGNVTGLTYDSQGRLLQTSWNGTPRINYSYDSSTGITVTNAVGATSQLWLTESGQIGHNEDPLGGRIRYEYDRQGNLVQQIAPDGTAYSFQYDARGNLTRSVDPLGQKVEFTYDSLFDNLVGVRDQRGNPLTYGYDTRGNLTSITYADGSAETFSIDSQGNISLSVNRRGQTIGYTYNSQGLLTRKDYQDGTSAVYTYDSRGNLLSAIDADSSVTNTYDAAGRLTQTTDGEGRFLEFSYDTAGRRTRMTDGDGSIVNYSYDSNGQLHRLSDGNNATLVTYTYDLLGRLVREENGNGTYTTYSYDAAGQLLNLVNYAADGTVNSRFDYTYDSLGRRTGATTLEGTTTYGYDAIGQLTSVILPDGRTIEYSYDAAGNRVSVRDSGVTTNYSTNTLNQYTTVGTTIYSYDTDGNLIGKTVNGVTSNFIYDVENRLIGVTTPDGTWSYEYDALGNRIATVHNGQRTSFLVDPTGLVDVVGEYDPSGNLVANYIHGLGLVGRVDGAGTSHYYDSDAIGSTVGLTGATGSYLNRYSYLPFGEALTTIETVDNPFEYVGQWGVTRESNGLDFMRSRFYDPTLGRFLSIDPLGISAGDTNFYRYAFNNPNTYTDPSGNLVFVPILIAAGIGALTGAATDAAIQGVMIGAGVQERFDGGSVLLSAGLGALGGGGTAALRNVGKQAGTVFSHALPNRWGNSSLFNQNSAIGRLNGQYVSPMRHYKHDPFYYGGKLRGGQRTGRGAWRNWGDKYGPYRRAFDRIPDWLKNSVLGGLLGNALSWIIRPSDPNDIVGPAGFGDENWIASQTLPYTIRFENQASATAPAQTVYITHPLDTDLDFRTFRLGSFGWGGLTFTVPENRSFYSERVDLTKEYGFLVDVFAGIDVQKGEAFWTLTTIDPATGETPENPLVGFLPPNNENGAGDGFVTYTVRPGRNAETGDVIDARATIIFDTEAPIDTPPIFNTLDVDRPGSEVNDLPATTATPDFLVSWTGTDTGAALATYTVYVSDNGGAYTVWLENTALTEATYTGTPGHTYTFYSVATDNAGNTETAPATADATIQVGGAVNQPPQISVNAGLTVDEGLNSTISASILAITDVDNPADRLVFTLGAIPAHGVLKRDGVTLAANATFTQADIDAGLLSYTHDGGETTSDSFSFTVSDGAGGSIGATTFTIAVNPVDDAPVVQNPIANIFVDEDADNTIIDLSAVFSDVDSPSIGKSVFANDNPDLVTATIVNNQLILDYGENQFGTATITVRGTSNGQSVDNTFTVTVNPVDDAPVVQNPIANIYVDEDADNTTIDLSVVFSDVDSPSIGKSVFANDNPALVTAAIVNNQLILDYGENQFGSANITIRGTSNGQFVDNTFTVTVAPVDDAPVVQNPIANISVDEDWGSTAIDLSDVFSDVDDTVIEKSVVANNNPALVTATIIDDELFLDYWDNDFGTATITVRGTSNGKSVDNTFTFTIDPVDDAPEVDLPIDDVSVDEDADNTTIDLDYVFSDVDNDSISKSVFANDNPALVTATIVNNQLILDYGENQFGTANITIRGTSNGKFVDNTFTVTVDPVDDAPVVQNPIANVSVNEDATDTIIDLSGVFSDVDDVVIEKAIHANDNPTLVTTAIVDNQLILDYGENRFGTATITVRGTSNGQFVDNTFTVTVSPVNDAPIVQNPIADTTATENQPFTFTLPANTFSDVDGDSLAYSLGTSLPSGLNFDANTGLFSGTPTTVGTYQITVIATDPARATVSDTFVLNVLRPVTVPDGGSVVSGGNNNDRLDASGKPGTYRLESGGGDDLLIGSNQRDVLRGGIGNDSLYGGGDVDRLLGDEGDDLLDGGPGLDFLTGGTGADRFVLTAGTGAGSVAPPQADRVLDFNPTEGDRFALNGITFGQLTFNSNQILVNGQVLAYVTDSVGNPVTGFNTRPEWFVSL